MSMTTRLLSAISQRTMWAEGHVFVITPERIGLAEGVRAAVAIGVLLGASILWHVPDLAYGAVAALWNCLCDLFVSQIPRMVVTRSEAVCASFSSATSIDCSKRR